MQKSYLALGCFWKPEETFRQLTGVIETEVGYAGGNSSNTNYEEVCTGKTGHAETVKITYDIKILMVNSFGQSKNRRVKIGGFSRLDYDKFPLNRYNCKLIFTYKNKQVVFINENTVTI